jgi:hypothetical protein
LRHQCFVSYLLAVLGHHGVELLEAEGQMGQRGDKASIAQQARTRNGAWAPRMLLSGVWQEREE